MNYGKLYKIVNNLNKKVYIGQTKNSLQVRFNEHICGARNLHYNSCLFRAIRKYGKEHFIILQIDEAEDKDSLNTLEKYYIDFYRKILGKEKVYNITDGGNCPPSQLGCKRSEITKKKMSKLRTQNIEKI